MVEVFLGLGSNIERNKYIEQGLAALHEEFDVQRISSVFESSAVGFDGDPFYNLVVKITTPLNVIELQKKLRAIEVANGGQMNSGKFSAKTLDLDILLYGDIVGCIDGVKLPRDEILFNAFVLWPLAEIAPQKIHPVKLESYKQLWEGFDKSLQIIKRIE